MSTPPPTDGADITLRDVIAHIQSVKSEFQAGLKDLRSEMKDMEKRLSTRIDANTVAIEVLTVRVDALNEGLTATIKDTIKIRQHVGMAVVEE